MIFFIRRKPYPYLLFFKFSFFFLFTTRASRLKCAALSPNKGSTPPKPLFPRSKKGGIYSIWCKPENKFYIGESGDVPTRLNRHKRYLRNRLHECAALQEDYNKYDLESFEFKKLQLAWGESDKLRREAYETLVLKTLLTEQRYNTYINWRVRPEELNSFYNSRHTDSARQLNREAHLGLPSGFAGRTQSDEVRQQISEQNRGQSSKDRRKPLKINGERFESVSEAEHKKGYSRRTIRQRCHSTHLQDAGWVWVTPEENSTGEKKQK